MLISVLAEYYCGAVGLFNVPARDTRTLFGTQKRTIDSRKRGDYFTGDSIFGSFLSRYEQLIGETPEFIF
jgi:hypothetical protein